MVISLTPKVVGKALADASTKGADVPVAKAAHRDTPPVNVIYRGRSPGLRVIITVRLPEVFASVTS
jgi:hypothetical protein